MTPHDWFFSLVAFICAIGLINNLDAAAHDAPNARFIHCVLTVIMVGSIGVVLAI